MKKIAAIAIALLMSMQLFAYTDYTGLQKLVLKFYSYQRAGLATGSANNANPGFTDASHKGDSYNGSPLDGGWYDAGDYIKFGMNMSYSVYCLLKGYDVFPSGYSPATGIPDVLTEAKFATDYFMKAVIDENTVVLDVGLAQEEHATWGVVNASGRTGSKILLCSGADIPATYAACLALMGTLYKKYDAAYADKCIAKAKVAFSFAKKKYDAGQSNWYSTAQLKSGAALYDYSKNNGVYTRQINDRIVAAGVELYRATNGADPMYKTWAQKTIGDNFNCMGYAFIGPLAAFEVWRQGLGGAGSLASNVSFVESKVKTTGFYNKVYQNSDWGTARDIGTAAFEYGLAYVITGDQTARDLYLKRVKDHIDWITGTNTKSQSFIIGVGNGPTNIHYRTTRNGPQGGVVSGPNGAGDWGDDGSAEHCEVAVDYNAGLVGALAFLNAITDPGDGVTISSAFTATPKKGIDFTKGSVAFTATFSKSVACTITIVGAQGKKTITKTGTSLNETWDGSADAGSFLSGEAVSASLKVGATIVAYDILKSTALQLAITNTKKAAVKGTVVDNFEDSNLANLVGGNWVKFGTKTGLSGTSADTATDNGSKVLKVTGTVSTSDNKNWAGVKATFNADGSAKDIGSIKSVGFDLRAAKNMDITVELEQSTITDGAYYQVVVPVRTASNRYSFAIGDFKQPEWKTSAKTLDLTKISALRFTMYDSTSRTSFYVDTVTMEGLTPSSVLAKNLTQLRSAFTPIVIGGALMYSVSQDIKGIVDLAIYNVAGKVVMKQSITTSSGKTISIPLSNLPAGMYTVCNSVNGTPVGNKFKFIHTK